MIAVGARYSRSVHLLRQQLSKWLMVRAGEGGVLLYLCLLALANGVGLAFGRGSSDALFFKRFGVEYLPHMFFLTAILLVLFSTAYVEFADRVRPSRMYVSIAVILAAFLGVNWAFMSAGSVWAFAAYFLVVSVAAEMVVVHFNLYLSQFLDFNQGKRLNPLIDAASRLGRVAGGLLMVLAARHWPTESIALLWVVVILVTMGFVLWWHRTEQRRPRLPRLRKRAPFADVREGLRFARQSSLLQLTGLGVFLLIILISIQEYVSSTIITRYFANDQELAAFFGWFFAITNGAVLLLQIAVTSRLLRRFGLKFVNLIFPVSTAVSFGFLTLSASLIPALIGRFNYMGMMPAFRSPVFNLFYSALPKYIQGRARAMVIGLILPVGLACAGLMLLWVPKNMVGQPLAFGGLLIALLYIFVKVKKNQAYSKTLLALIQRQVFTDKQRAIEGIGHFSPEITQRVADLVLHTDELETARSYASLLIEHAPAAAAALLRDNLQRLPAPLVEYMLQALATTHLPAWREALQLALQHEAARVRITAAVYLEEAEDPSLLPPMLESWLKENNPRLQAQAARIMLKHPAWSKPDEAESALVCLMQGEPGAQICALNAVAELGDPARRSQASALLDAPVIRVRAAAIRACAALSEDDAERIHIISSASRDSDAAVRVSAAQALLHVTAPDIRLELLQDLLRDREYAVRRAAQLAAAACMPQTLGAYASALTTYYDQFPMQNLLCKYLALSQLEGKNALLEGVAQTHLSAAYDKKTLAQQCAQDPDTTQQFLALVLTEDVQQHIDLVLEVLSLIDPSGIMASVQAALLSENRPLRAQALESLRNAADSRMLLELCEILESELEHVPLRQAAPTAALQGRAMLEWCANHGSAWLRQCAETLLRRPSSEPLST